MNLEKRLARRISVLLILTY